MDDHNKLELRNRGGRAYWYALMSTRGIPVAGLMSDGLMFGVAASCHVA